jgi:LCP family protein required for cell wall assembly
MEENDKKNELSLLKVFIKSTALSLVFVIFFLIITLVIYGFILLSKYNLFLKSANTSHQEFISIIKKGWNHQPLQSNGHKNLLVMGVDKLENRQNMPVLTDTMMLFSINLQSGSIKSLSLPRDIYNQDYQTKINALLHYGDEKRPENPINFPIEVVSEMTSLPIHHGVVLSLSDLEEVINLVGGIEIDIQESFVDTEFPRSDVDITVEKDPKKLYETVIFQKGKEVMNGDRALKYIRSRHSNDDQGTDIARGKRQQQVISSIFDKLANPKYLLKNPQVLGEIYSFYNKNFDQYLSIVEIIASGKSLIPYRNQVEFENFNLSIYPEIETGVLYNPPTWKNGGQWIYEIREKDNFKEEVNNLLK